MKKTWVILFNVFIMLAMLTFVVLYSGFENRNNTRMQIEHFENTTITMEHVTENTSRANSVSVMYGPTISTARI